MDIMAMERSAMTSMNAVGGLAIGMQLAQTQTALTAAAAMMVSELMGSRVLITMSAKRVSMIAMRKRRASTLRARIGVHVSKVTVEMVKSAKRLRREVCSPVEFFLCYVLSYCFCDDNGQDGDANLRRKSDTRLDFTKFI